MILRRKFEFKFKFVRNWPLPAGAFQGQWNSWNEPSRLRIPTGRRQTSWICTSAAEELNQGAQSIQPKFQPVRPGKEDHLKKWTRFFEAFPVGPNRSIEFWTEISGNFGWMDRAHGLHRTNPTRSQSGTWTRDLQNSSPATKPLGLLSTLWLNHYNSLKLKRKFDSGSLTMR